MAAFFERLLAEDDPTRFAAMAETLPEPPSFDHDDVATAEWTAPVQTSVEVEPAPQPADAWGTAQYEQAHTDAPVDATAEADVSGWESRAPSAETSVDAPVAEEPVAEAPIAEAADVAEAPVAEAPVADEAVEAAADPYSWQPEPAPDAPTYDETPAVQPQYEATAEPTADDTGDLFSLQAEAYAAAERAGRGCRSAPRGARVGQRLRRAEAEAAAFTAEPTTDEQEIPTIADDALAARLAGLVAEEPATASEVGLDPRRRDRSRERREHRRLQAQPARVEGVRSVGVSSGPDGEFVFAVTHDPGLDLADGIATLPGFGARVTNEAPGRADRRGARPRIGGLTSWPVRPSPSPFPPARPRRSRPSCARPASRSRPSPTPTSSRLCSPAAATSPSRSSTERPTSTSRSSITRCSARTASRSRP